ncbi:hypothetical protein N5D77_22555 [Comamonas thiooxydans]|uniref:Uncharacterized protein n=1 Tax=Comamonas thiooxydans TaxID=363952 RepID=A0AA42TW70_9BURK|nr:hypothetical protein [Comamonas thiooxydans]MDH1336859.1 hypothetical protein [Comamonas thiooxydans]MDH1743776.1 hypothetical protein [Comamonas thiooxydans]MDH1789362.1 hypothetical protein [Comamonas thiooxydans]
MLKRIHQNKFLIATVLFAALAFFFLYRLCSGPANMSDMAGLVVCCAFFGWAALKDLERKLNGRSEPKMGSTQGSGLVGVQRDCRNDLEHSLVHALAPHLVNTKSAAELGAFIRDVANSIQGRGCQVPSAVCTCGPNAGCTNCPAGGSQSLQAAQDGLSQSATRTAEAWAGVLGKTS